MKTVLDNIDVICYYARDGSIRPLRIRITGDDGTYRVYRIESYHEVEGQGARTMPDGVYVSNMTRIYECIVTDFGKEKLIRVYYEPGEMRWRMTVTSSRGRG